jgi:hypothetical protein
MMRIIGPIFAVIAILLGGLWLLQGLGLVEIRPILCFADCAPVQGPSTRWAVIGAATVAIGGFGIFLLRKPASK